MTILEKTCELQIKDAWNLHYAKPEENTQEEIDWLIETIDKVIKKVNDEKRIEYYTKKGAKIKKYIKKVGFDSATQLVVLLK